MSPPSIAIVVQGRFHGFDLARALIDLDVPVRVLTNYPAFIASRFGVPRANLPPSRRTAWRIATRNAGA